MIKKFISIKNVGRFENYAVRGNVELQAFNLVFAENGRGKTTVGDILRSVQSGDGSYILGRRRLGSTGAPEVTILTTTGPISAPPGAPRFQTSPSSTALSFTATSSRATTWTTITAAISIA